ncbi:MAG: lactate utilization protein [Chloroflexi bacterium]|nr:lactate utilization protein [Chloroflexota bacterium]
MAELDEARGWYNETLANAAVASLEKNNIPAFYVKTKEEAREKVLSLIPPGSTVGHGGSLTLRQAGIFQAIRSGNYHFLDRERPGITEEEVNALRKESLGSDIFLLSANAVTMDGKLVNVDGTGNRLAALIYGPRKVIVVAGINKVVPNVEAAWERIRNFVTPVHARRGGRNVPCAKIGRCVDCKVPGRMCNAEVTIDFQRDKNRITVIIVGEELGI